MNRSQEHWDRIYSNTSDDSSLGWYEKDSGQTVKFLEMTSLNVPSTVFIAGAGTSTLAEDLCRAGYRLIVNDLSSVALTALQDRIGSETGTVWLNHDLSTPLPEQIPMADVWIDRAVLHFLLEETQISDYFSNMNKTIRPGGYALLAQFSRSAAARCAGLDLHRYSLEEICTRAGDDFTLVHHEIYDYVNPAGGQRPYLYALMKKRPDPQNGA